MKKLLLAATACGVLASSVSAFAGCTTQEDVAKKVAELKNAGESYMNKHPDKEAEIEKKLDAIIEKHSVDLANAGKDLANGGKESSAYNELCKAYDEMIAATK